MAKWTSPHLVLGAFLLGAGIGVPLGFGVAGPELARDVAHFGAELGGLVRRFFEMIALPLVVTSAATGIAALGGRRVAGLFARALPYFVATSALAVAVGLASVAGLRPGVGVRLAGAGAVRAEELGLGALVWSRIAAVVPASPVQAMADLDLLPAISCAGIFGLFLATTGEPARRARELVESLHAVVARMASFAAALAPIAVFAFALSAGAGHTLSELAPITGLVLALAIAYTFHATVVLPLFMALGARRSPAGVMLAMGPAAAHAFTSASVLATLPVAMSHARERAGISNEVSGLVLPFGAAAHSDGTALYLAGGALFAAQAHGVELGLGGIAILGLGSLVGSFAAAGLPHGAPLVLTALLSALGVPLEALGLLLAMDWFQAMGRAVVSLQSHAAVAAILQRAETRRSRVSGT